MHLGQRVTIDGTNYFPAIIRGDGGCNTYVTLLIDKPKTPFHLWEWCDGSRRVQYNGVGLGFCQPGSPDRLTDKGIRELLGDDYDRAEWDGKPKPRAFVSGDRLTIGVVEYMIVALDHETIVLVNDDGNRFRDMFKVDTRFHITKAELDNHIGQSWEVVA